MRVLTTLSLLFFAACGAVTEQRASALEGRLAALEGADTDTRLVALIERLSAVEARTADESITPKEPLIEQGAEPLSPAPPDSPLAKTSTDPIWMAVDTVLGLPITPIKAHDGNYEISRPWLRHELEAMATTGRFPKLAATKKGGVQLKGIRPDSLADRLGLKSNDVITKVNGKEVSTVEDVATALRAAESVVEVTIKRRRDESVQIYRLIN